jgi:hypothetical protein
MTGASTCVDKISLLRESEIQFQIKNFKDQRIKKEEKDKKVNEVRKIC